MPFLTEDKGRLEDLASRLNTAELKLAQAQVELRAGILKLEAKEQRFQDFRKLVVSVALREAKENDWCDDGVGDALRELGLEDLIPALVKLVKLEYHVHVEGELGWDEERYIDEATQLCDGGNCYTATVEDDR